MKALVIEDEAAIAAAVCKGLHQEGFVTEIASNGVDGLWLAQESDFDVLVLDLMIPGLSGYEVCRQLRAGGSRVPILVLTAKDGEYDEADALDLGADAYLTKPFSFVVLLAHLRAVMRRSPVEGGPMLVAGDVRLDLGARRSWGAGGEVRLTAREFALAEYLVRRKGLVTSRAQIAEHVWDAELGPDSNVVDVYVGYLRKKLDRPYVSSCIETVRGSGYRLVDSAPHSQPAQGL